MSEKNNFEANFSGGSQTPTYMQRFMHALDFRNNTFEAVSRTLLPTVIASIAISAYASSGESTPLPPVYKQEPTPSHTHTAIKPGGQFLEPGKISETTVRGPGAELEFPQVFASDFQASAFNDKQSVELETLSKKFTRILQKSPDAKLHIRVDGFSSDESASDSVKGDLNLGAISEKNNALALQRARLVENFLKSSLPKSSEISIEVTGAERQLSSTEIGLLDTVAKNHGKSRAELIKAFNGSSIELNKKDSILLNSLLVKNRGADITSEIQSKETPQVNTCDAIVHVGQTPDTKVIIHDPENPGFTINLLPLIIPPLPRRRRKEKPQDEPKDLPVELEPITDTYVPIKPPRFNMPSLPKLPLWPILVALLPFPWMNGSTEEKTVHTHNQCSTTTTYEPARANLWMNLAGVAIYRALSGKNEWNKQVYITGKARMPFDSPSTATTYKEHDIIYVDDKGQIIDLRHVPKQVL